MAADVEKLLTDWLPGQITGGGVRVVTELPDDLETPGNLPIVQVEEAGGTGEIVPTLDVCDVDIDVYAGPSGGEPARKVARDLAEQIRAAVVSLPRQGPIADDNLTSVSKVVTLRKPTRMPYDDSEIRRFGASYRLILHSRA